MKTYDVDEFTNAKNENCPIEEIVEKKISLLHDFCLIKGESQADDVRELLSSCGNEIQMDNILHDILVGKTTMESVLKYRGILQ